MSSSPIDPLWTPKVTLPVKLVGDRWEFLYGGEVKVAQKTIADLTVATRDLTDESFRERIAKSVTVKVLEQGTPLLVALTDLTTKGARAGDWPEVTPQGLPLGATRFERITLGPAKSLPGGKPLTPEMSRGGLWIRVRGLDRCELATGTVKLPLGIEPLQAVSLNHAFTILSKKYESHRISNTGNVYARIFYQDKDGGWYHLDDLRKGVQAQAERALLSNAWAEIEEILGWRPVA